MESAEETKPDSKLPEAEEIIETEASWTTDGKTTFSLICRWAYELSLLYQILSTPIDSYILLNSYLLHSLYTVYSI